MNAVETFAQLGQAASYHYADNTGKEWRLGDVFKAQALNLFDQHPELEAEMREAARGFLWSLNLARPVKNG